MMSDGKSWHYEGRGSTIPEALDNLEYWISQGALDELMEKIRSNERQANDNDSDAGSI